jgi:hypothetical protein
MGPAPPLPVVDGAAPVVVHRHDRIGGKTCSLLPFRVFAAAVILFAWSFVLFISAMARFLGHRHPSITPIGMLNVGLVVSSLPGHHGLDRALTLGGRRGELAVKTPSCP